MSYIYSQSTLGASDNQITFNDETADPYYRMKSRVPTKRELVEFDVKLPEGLGDADFESEIGKMYIILGGTMYAETETSYDQGRRNLRKVASLAVSQNDANSDAGYVPYVWSEFDGNKQLNVKVEYVDVPESSRSGGKQPFNLICKIKYPVILSATPITATLGSSTATTSGSSNLAFTLPRALGLTTYSSNGAVTNAGDLPTYPSFVINGPITTPRITNTTTGEFIELAINLPTSGDSAIVTYDQDTLIITQAGNSIANKLSNASTLFRLAPGVNQLTLTGATVGAGANATLSANSAWPAS